MEKSALAFPGGGAGFLRPPAGRGLVADGFPFTQAPFFPRGPHCDYFLRLQKEPGYRHSDDERDFCRSPHRAAGDSHHGVPPDPVDGLFLPGPEVGEGRGKGRTTLRWPLFACPLNVRSGAGLRRIACPGPEQ